MNTHNFSLALVRRDSFRRSRMTARLAGTWLAGTRWRVMAQPPCRCLEGRSLFCPHCLLIIYQQPQLLVKSHVRPVVDECKRFAAFTHATAARGRQPHLCRPPTLQRKRAGTTHWVGTAVQIRPSLEVCCFVDGFLMILAQRQAHCTALPGRWERWGVVFSFLSRLT